MTAVLAQVHKAVAAVAEDDDLDMDPALAACVQLALAGPQAVPPPEPAARPSLTVSAFDMHLHAATTVAARPHRNRRNRRKTQDGRPLRRYRRRWKVERIFAWLGNFRRIVVRWERHVHNYLGFVTLACIVVLLRHL